VAAKEKAREKERERREDRKKNLIKIHQTSSFHSCEAFIRKRFANFELSPSISLIYVKNFFPHG
jgi:hypothetical protein